MVKNKHLTLSERIEIYECLCKGMSFKDIARRVEKDPTTISKEVRKHLVVRRSETRLPSSQACPRLLSAPYVCNGCSRRYKICKYDKQIYEAPHADREYRKLLSESREGIALNKQEFYRMDEFVSEKLKQGQHIYHIVNSAKDKVPFHISSIYRYINKGYMSVNRIDLPRAVKFKPRKISSKDIYVPKRLKTGRTYDDFLEYISDNDISSYIEMDTVEGRKGGKCILTLNFNVCNFMVGFLLDHKAAYDVTAKLNALKERFHAQGISFTDIFPLILTDNGSEFSDVNSIEYDPFSDSYLRLFFCDPYVSSQKPRVEKNHTLLRDILPKGSSFDSLSQEKLNIIFSHVNAVRRKILYGKSPFEMFTFIYGNKITSLLEISHISPEEVIQSPLLLKNI